VSLVIVYKLLSMMVAVLLGWVAGRARWLGRPDQDPARVLSNVAFFIFVPALLFRTAVRIDLGALPWRMLAAYFMPTVALALLVHAAMQLRRRHQPGLDVAMPSVRAISATYGNNVQLGIPMAAALFGEAGLGLHLMLVSVHALILLSVITALAELDLARDQSRQQARAGLAATLRSTLRNTVIHPVVLPVLLGLGWNGAGLALPGVLDEVLKLLGGAVVPLCLVLIGLSLAYHGARGHVRGALEVSLLKLVLLPAIVLVTAHWGFGLSGLPLSVLVLMAAAPVGTNALIFAQRYRALQAEATTAIVLSTLAFVLAAPLWLWLLGQLPA
jgi:predicted permease